MTLGDNYSNVEKPQTYLAGLRGCGMETSTAMTKVDLTLDVADNASHFIVPTKYKSTAGSASASSSTTRGGGRRSKQASSSSFILAAAESPSASSAKSAKSDAGC